MTLQIPSGCFTMSIFGPLQKFSRTFAASGALRRISTCPLLSTRGYCASQTLVEAGRKSEDSCAYVSGAMHSRIARVSPERFMFVLVCGPEATPHWHAAVTQSVLLKNG